MNIRDLAKARVAVVGDCIRDRWIYGHVDRISPEAPCPVFVEDRIEETPGGAANVSAGIEALGATARLWGKSPVYAPIKTRYIVNGQQMFRADCEDCSSIMIPDAEQIIREVKEFAPDIIVISDYAKGVCTPALCRGLMPLGMPVIVDPKGKDWSKYAGAAVITPNEKEFEPGMWHPDVEWVMETCGAKGIKLWPLSGKPIEIAATAREVFDVCGAGDTVVATLACCMAIGMDLIEAARLANAAAGVVVGKRGTATCSLEELEAAL